MNALFVWLVAVMAAAAACSTRPPPGFPHRAHLAKTECGATPSDPGCLSCVSCHAVTETSPAHHLPDESTCARCHRTDAHERRAKSHAELARPNGTIAFDHARHLSMREINGQCVGCHAGVVSDGKPSLPPMKQCFSCHEHDAEWKRGECTPCHDRAELVRIVPQTFARHAGSFVRNHGKVAAEQTQLCRSCHEQADCDVCHDTTQSLMVERRRPDAIESQQVHRGDFLSRHAMEAQATPARCLSCHTPQTCDACHAERGVSGNVLGARNPHPAAWITGDASSPSGHGREARRDILLCASCHEQGPATNCIRCHRVGGYGGNPHPRGWFSTLGVQSEMCRYCHD